MAALVLEPKRVVGLDISKEMITAAQEYHSSSQSIEWVAADVGSWGLANAAAFDVATSFMALVWKGVCF